MFIQKLKVYFGVVDIFVIFLYSTDFRKDKGKEGRKADMAAGIGN